LDPELVVDPPAMTPILLLAEARGESEARISSTLVGASGVEILTQMNEAGMIRLSPVDHDLISLYYRTTDPRHIAAIWDLHPEVQRTNVFNMHPPGNDLRHFLGPKSDAIPGYPRLAVPKATAATGYHVRAEFAPELSRLGDELLRHNPNIIVALGNVALWALTGQTGIGKLRGTTLLSSHTVAGFKLIPTYHPASIFRNYDNRPVVIADLMKATRESAYAEVRRPEREIWIEPTLDDIREFFSRHGGCDLMSVDIETAGDRITCIGFAPSSAVAIVIPFDDGRGTSGNYWIDHRDEIEAWRHIRAVLENSAIPKLFQNGAYDIAFLYRSMKIKVMGATHDTMLLHHALQPEALKSLGFLGSIYSDEGTWKEMRKTKSTKRED
jgi:hypothetical protein